MPSIVDSKDSLSILINIQSHDKDCVNRLPNNLSFENDDLKPIEKKTIPNTNKEVEEQIRRKKENQGNIQVKAEDAERCLLSKFEEHSDNINGDELKNMMKTIKDLTDDVQNLHCITFDLTEKLRARNLFASKSASTFHNSTENLCAVSKAKSSIFQTKKAFWNQKINSSLDKPENVSGCKGKYSSVRNAPKTTGTRSISYDITPAKNRPNTLGERSEAEVCPIVSSEIFEINSACMQPKEKKQIGLDGKLAISLVDSVLPHVQALMQQNGMSKIEAEHAKLETKIHLNDNKLYTLMMYINELTSISEKRRQEDTIVEDSKYTDSRKEPKNVSFNASSAVTNSMCTFPECVCRLIESKNAVTQIANDSHSNFKNNDRSQHLHESFQQTEQCMDIFNSVPIERKQCPPLNKLLDEKMNNSAAKNLKKSNALYKANDGPSIPTEYNRITECCAYCRVQSILDRIISINQNDQLLSLVNKFREKDESCKDKINNSLSHYSSAYCNLKNIDQEMKSNDHCSKKCPYSHNSMGAECKQKRA